MRESVKTTEIWPVKHQCSGFLSVKGAIKLRVSVQQVLDSKK